MGKDLSERTQNFFNSQIGTPEQRKAQGKRPYHYFHFNGSLRVPVVLQYWMRWHADSFEEPDSAYSLHKTLEDYELFRKGINKSRWGNPVEHPIPEVSFVTRATYERLTREKKRGVFIEV